MLRRSHDRKTANLATPGGKSKIANAFGLPAGFSCPGATKICDKVCYAKKIERMPYLKSVRTNLWDNWHTLVYASYLDGIDGMVALLDSMIKEFSAECEKKNAEKVFRIHWDGDFFSQDYALAWGRVILANSDVHFWAYTRTFNIVWSLAGIANLSLYLSVDAENVNSARLVKNDYPSVNLATLAETMQEAKQMTLSITDKAGAQCPELKGNLPLITAKGGACFTCGLCVKGRANVRFSTSKG